MSSKIMNAASERLSFHNEVSSKNRSLKRKTDLKIYLKKNEPELNLINKYKKT